LLLRLSHMLADHGKRKVARVVNEIGEILVDPMGLEKIRIKGDIHRLDLVNHKIILKEK